MNCKNFKKYIIEYLDGDMPQQDKVSFLSHLETCQGCKERWGYQFKLSSELGSGIKSFEKGLEAPRELLYDILREIRNIPQPKYYLDEILSAVFKIPAMAYTSIIVILGTLVTFSCIWIGNIRVMHPGERMVLAHVRLPKKAITRQLAYSTTRKWKIDSRSFIEMARRG